MTARRLPKLRWSRESLKGAEWSLGPMQPKAFELAGSSDGVEFQHHALVRASARQPSQKRVV